MLLNTNRSYLGNAANTKSRQQGKYYDDKWQKVLDEDPAYVSITSYNEWMEGKSINYCANKQCINI